MAFLALPHWPNPNWQSTAFVRWEGFGVERFRPLIHLPPNLYKKYLFKNILTVEIATNPTNEPHAFGRWGAPVPNIYPAGPFYIVGMDTDPMEHGVFITQVNPGPTYGEVYLVWCRWLRIVEARLVPRPFIGQVDLPPPPTRAGNPSLPFPNNFQGSPTVPNSPPSGVPSTSTPVRGSPPDFRDFVRDFENGVGVGSDDDIEP